MTVEELINELEKHAPNGDVKIFIRMPDSDGDIVEKEFQIESVKPNAMRIGALIIPVQS